MVLVVKNSPVNVGDIKKKKKKKSLEWQKAQQWNKSSEIQKQLLEIKYMELRDPKTTLGN